jgi:hypothetical protein
MKKFDRVVFWIISVVIILLLAAIALPSFIKARNVRSCNACSNVLRQIDAAKEQCIRELGWTNGTPCDTPDARKQIDSLMKGPILCSAGGTYTYNPIGVPPTCSAYNTTNWNTRSHLLTK